MTSMRVSSILNHGNKERCDFRRRLDEEHTHNQMCYNQASNFSKSLLEQMPSLTSKHVFSFEGNPNLLPLDHIQEPQLYGPMKYYSRSSSNDVRHFTNSVEFDVPTVSALNSDRLPESAFSSLRERTIFECWFWYSQFECFIWEAMYIPFHKIFQLSQFSIFVKQ